MDTPLGSRAHALRPRPVALKASLLSKGSSLALFGLGPIFLRGNPGPSNIHFIHHARAGAESWAILGNHWCTRDDRGVSAGSGLLHPFCARSIPGLCPVLHPVCTRPVLHRCAPSLHPCTRSYPVLHPVLHPICAPSRTQTIPGPGGFTPPWSGLRGRPIPPPCLEHWNQPPVSVLCASWRDEAPMT